MHLGRKLPIYQAPPAQVVASPSPIAVHMLITVMNQKGGCGKTTLTVHLVCWLIDRGHTVAALDADGQAATHRWLAVAAPDVGVLRAYEPAEITRAVAVLRQGGCPLVVADAPPGLDARTRTLLELSDLVLVPAGPSMLDMKATFQAMTIAREVGASRGTEVDARIVLMRTRAGYRQTKVAEAGLNAVGFRLAAATISEREVFKRAAENDTVVTRMSAPAAAAQAAEEIDRLFYEVLPDEFTQAAVSRSQEAGRTTRGDAAATGCAAPAGRAGDATRRAVA
jgi:chromosome partitioning protein